MQQPIKTPLDAGLISRVANGLRYIIGGDTAWMSPAQPLAPIATPDTAGRMFDYPVAFNTNTQPRSHEKVKFSELRGLADNLDLVRLAIETRKDQIEKMQWSIKPRDEKAKPDDRCKELVKFFAEPDKTCDWGTWLRMLIEDLLVIDAPTLYVRLTRGGAPYAFEPVDGATIKRIISVDGRTPLPPEPAYQQILKGVPAVNYTANELIYAPRNRRTNKVYGFPPVEQIIMIINIALRRQLHTLEYYTEGNVPEAITNVPENWSAQQIKEFQLYWDSIIEGNTAARRHMKFVPHGMDMKFTKQPDLKGEYDEWIARVVCYAFSLPPTAFIKQINRATADNAHQMGLEEGLMPLMLWVKRLIDRLIVQYWGWSDLEFCWTDTKDIDPKVQAEIDATYINCGVLTPNEVRARLGHEALPDDPPPAKQPQADTEDNGDDGDGAVKKKRSKACVMKLY